MLQRLAMFLMLAISLWITTAIANNDRLAFACECIPPQPPNVELSLSTAVFSGKVANIEDSGRIATFDVYKTWKGVSNEPVTVVADMHCGSAFEEGKGYLVYSNADREGTLYAAGCGVTKSLDNADTDLVVLGEGRDVSNALLYSVEIWSYPNPFLLVGIAAGVVGAITAGMLLRRTRQKLS